LNPSGYVRFSRERAKRIQQIIAGKALITPLPPVRRVAAVDVSYSRKTGLSHAAAVVYDLSTDRIVEKKTSTAATRIPYMPGFLAFRELEPMLKALFKLQAPYDVILVDGHGISHPRRAGIATHLGVILDKPTVGVAKKILVGTVTRSGNTKIIIHGGEPIAVVHDKNGLWKPLYVSPGNRADLKTAYNLIDKLRKTPSLPTPLKEADALSKLAKTSKRQEYD